MFFHLFFFSSGLLFVNLSKEKNIAPTHTTHHTIIAIIHTCIHMSFCRRFQSTIPLQWSFSLISKRWTINWVSWRRTREPTRMRLRQHASSWSSWRPSTTISLAKLHKLWCQQRKNRQKSQPLLKAKPSAKGEEKMNLDQVPLCIFYPLPSFFSLFCFALFCLHSRILHKPSITWHESTVPIG